jgi:hypothetical protein
VLSVGVEVSWWLFRIFFQVQTLVVSLSEEGKFADSSVLEAQASISVRKDMVFRALHDMEMSSPWQADGDVGAPSRRVILSVVDSYEILCLAGHSALDFGEIHDITLLLCEEAAERASAVPELGHAGAH